MRNLFAAAAMTAGLLMVLGSTRHRIAQLGGLLLLMGGLFAWSA